MATDWQLFLSYGRMVQFTLQIILGCIAMNIAIAVAAKEGPSTSQVTFYIFVAFANFPLSVYQFCATYFDRLAPWSNAHFTLGIDAIMTIMWIAGTAAVAWWIGSGTPAGVGCQGFTLGTPSRCQLSSATVGIGATLIVLWFIHVPFSALNSWRALRRKSTAAKKASISAPLPYDPKGSLSSGSSRTVVGEDVYNEKQPNMPIPAYDIERAQPSEPVLLKTNQPHPGQLLSWGHSPTYDIERDAPRFEMQRKNTDQSSYSQFRDVTYRKRPDSEQVSPTAPGHGYRKSVRPPKLKIWGAAISEDDEGRDQYGRRGNETATYGVTSARDITYGGMPAIDSVILGSPYSPPSRNQGMSTSYGPISPPQTGPVRQLRTTMRSPGANQPRQTERVKSPVAATFQKYYTPQSRPSVSRNDARIQVPQTSRPLEAKPYDYRQQHANNLATINQFGSVSSSYSQVSPRATMNPHNNRLDSIKESDRATHSAGLVPERNALGRSGDGWTSPIATPGSAAFWKKTNGMQGRLEDAMNRGLDVRVKS